MSTERILVHKNIRTEFEKKLDALAKGTSLLYGDAATEKSTKTRMRPVIISGVKSDMEIYQTESFGPTVSLIEIETGEDTLRIDNGTEYGLSSATFTKDLRRGLRIAKEIETGVERDQAKL
ncbi:Aldehyde/histidinol dehydrogenase [Lasiosphaeria hispida]|uniref:Aldehyde/histidinol dehydrogenase n=1 Tax=Lasiosphaeria hispida TaxID=260671 RepID=A0AAJ0MD91_9PEZI|nr:Aldehyde/histidinol dehydrogenase [Lasiosphaeria hispida]